MKASYLEKLFKIAWLIVVGVCFCVTFVLCYLAADSLFLEQQQESGIIIGKSFSPARTTTGIFLSGKAMIPTTTRTPDKWMVFVRSNSGKEASTSVSRDFYSMANNGKKVCITYHSGRMLGEMYFVQLSSE